MADRTKNEGFWTFWKAACLAMLFSNIVLFSYILFKFNVLTGIRDAAHNVDSTIVFSLSLLQTIIALGAFAGFWLVRGSARDAARDAAENATEVYVKKFLEEDRGEDVLNRAVKEHLVDDGEPIIYRAVKDAVMNLGELGLLNTSNNVDDFLDAIDEETA